MRSLPKKVDCQNETFESVDLEVERILAMTDEEVLAEVLAEGRDPAADAQRVRELFEQVAARHPAVPVDPLNARVTWRLDEYGEAAAVFDRPRSWPRVIARALVLAGILLGGALVWFLIVGFLAELP